MQVPGGRLLNNPGAHLYAFTRKCRCVSPYQSAKRTFVFKQRIVYSDPPQSGRLKPASTSFHAPYDGAFNFGVFQLPRYGNVVFLQRGKPRCRKIATARVANQYRHAAQADVVGCQP